MIEPRCAVASRLHCQTLQRELSCTLLECDFEFYIREQIQKNMAVTGAGLEGIVAAESEICYIDGDAGILSYRGYNIHTLAENATFEEVIFLLWNGVLPKQAELDELKKDLVAHREIPAEVTAFLKQVGKSDAHGRAAHRRFHAVAFTIPTRRTCRPKRTQRKAVKLMAQTATIVTTFDRLRKGKAVVAGDPGAGLRRQFPLHADRQEARRSDGARLRRRADAARRS